MTTLNSTTNMVALTNSTCFARRLGAAARWGMSVLSRKRKALGNATFHQAEAGRLTWGKPFAAPQGSNARMRYVAASGAGLCIVVGALGLGTLVLDLWRHRPASGDALYANAMLVLFGVVLAAVAYLS